MWHPVLIHGGSEILCPSDGWFFVIDLLIIFAKSGDNGLISHLDSCHLLFECFWNT